MGKGFPPATFGEWLKQQRRRLDLTQEELAQSAGCSVFALRKIEAGERRPSKQLAALLAAALSVPQEELETFLRVARGERPLERLPVTVLDELDLPEPQVEHTVVLPVPATQLVGREAELAAVDRIFLQPHCRLITLTGPGGIGKTRLAIEYASSQASSFPGGVYYIPLASLESVKLIIPTLAEVVGFTFVGPANLKEQLFRYLKSQYNNPTLFVLDNIEHLLEPSANEAEDGSVPELIAEMLQLLPALKILATSRERLNLRGEWTYDLHGLSVPSEEMIGEMENYSAVALFLQSARQTKADFNLINERKQDILRICQFVDGIPLAIELAAAWVGVLSCAEIAQEIATNIDLLATTMHDIPRRHRSIRAAFDHSWNLLNDEEKCVLQQISVFRGGFDREAADQVAGASLPLLASLVSKSLVRRTESGRYDLHEVIRQYAYSYMRAQSWYNSTHDRHCLYYLAVLRDQEGALKSGGQQEAKRGLYEEIENIRLAWAWAVEHGYEPALQQAGRCLSWLYETTGLYQEGIEQFNLLVKKVKRSPLTQASNQLLGEGLAAQSLLFFRKGDYYQASDNLEESISLLRGLKPEPIPDPFVYLGIIMHLNGELDRGRELLLEGLDHARAVGDRWFEAYSIYNLGYISSLTGKYAEGYAQMADGMTIWRELGDPYSIALGLNYLSPTLIRLGQYKTACDGLEESIRLSTVVGNRWGAGTAYRILGQANIAMGNYTEAQSLLNKSLDIFNGFTTGWDIASSMIFLAQAVMLDGNPDQARQFFIEAYDFAMQAGVPPLALDAILGIATLQAEAGDDPSALEFALFVRNHPRTSFETKEKASELCLRIEKQTPVDLAESARKKTAGWTLESVRFDLPTGE